MILTCPSCGTQYVVKDGAIPPQGRQVRCASCKHSWHQDPEPAGAADDGASIPEEAVFDPSTGPEAEERAYEAVALAAEDEADESSIGDQDDLRDAVEPAEHEAQPPPGYAPV